MQHKNETLVTGVTFALVCLALPLSTEAIQGCRNWALTPPGRPSTLTPQRQHIRLGIGSLQCRDATSSLVEATACQLLRLVLRRSEDSYVSCSVKSNALELLGGKIEGATINGRRWTSRLGLTAREVSVDVGEVSFDVRSLFARRLLEFKRPPCGEAVVVFNERDFANFLVHQLVRQAHIGGHALIFRPTGVLINPEASTITFGARWKALDLVIELSQVNGKLTARVVRSVGIPLLEEEAQMIATGVSNYFNSLRIDLDGPVLNFASLSFIGSGSRGGRLRLALDIIVRKFPSLRSVAMF
ncbi:unnamed protein product [Discosporangium mesarthrocarpum]